MAMPKKTESENITVADIRHHEAMEKGSRELLAALIAAGYV